MLCSHGLRFLWTLSPVGGSLHHTPQKAPDEEVMSKNGNGVGRDGCHKAREDVSRPLKSDGTKCWREKHRKFKSLGYLWLPLREQKL